VYTFYFLSMPDYTMFSDIELQHLLRSGNQEAFRAIYDRYKTDLHQQAYSKLKERNEASDVVREVWIERRESDGIPGALRMRLSQLCCMDNVVV
jgi:hypothetical protein